MEKEFPRWLAGPGRQSIYAVLSATSWVEHQKLGARYRVFNFEVKIYPDYLRMAVMLDNADGGFEVLSRAEYDVLRKEIECMKVL